MDLKIINRRIKDLEDQQKSIINKIHQSKPDVSQIIEYGKDLDKLNIKIEELQALSWER